MYYVKEIMNLLDVSEEMAWKILNWMSMGGFDLSECTQEEFDQNVIHIHNMITAGVYN